MITDAQWTAWLKRDAARIYLLDIEAQIGGTESIVRVSDIAYTTSPTDTPANTPYTPCASVGTGFVERLSLTDTASLQHGTVRLRNVDGALDAWVAYVWTNRTLTVSLGDPSWPRADFRVRFVGTIAEVYREGTDIMIKFRDKMERLNTPVTEAKLAGDTLNSDAVVPVGVGEIHNATPALKSAATRTYQFNSVLSELIIEVKDNAVPIAFSGNLPTGEFTLPVEPKGTITVSFQGDAVEGYKNTVAGCIRRLVTAYGKVSTRFANTDLELDTSKLGNLVSFDTANPQKVGLWLPTRTNVITAIQTLANSIGAQAVMSRTGLLRLFKIDLPVVTTTRDITPAMYMAGTFKAAGTTPIQASVVLLYNKNWTVQTELKTTMPAAHRALYALEWLRKSFTVTTVKTAHRLDTEPEPKETMLLDSVEAQTECTRLANLWSVAHELYEFEGKPELLELELGEKVRVYYRRFGFLTSKNAMVISLEPIYKNSHVKVGIIV
jgi:hypothetical protein